MIKAGAQGKAEATVGQDMTARTVGSGELNVLATPVLAALVEEAAWKSISKAI